MGKEREPLYLCEGTRVRSFFDKTEQVPVYERKKAAEMFFSRYGNILDYSKECGVKIQNPYVILKGKMKKCDAQNEIEEKFVDADEDVKSISKSK